MAPAVEAKSIFAVEVIGIIGSCRIAGCTIFTGRAARVASALSDTKRVHTYRRIAEGFLAFSIGVTAREDTRAFVALIVVLVIEAAGTGDAAVHSHGASRHTGFKLGERHGVTAVTFLELRAFSIGAAPQPSASAVNAAIMVGIVRGVLAIVEVAIYRGIAPREANRDGLE